LDLVVSGTKDAVMMVECSAKEVSEEQMVSAIARAHEAIREIVELQESLVRQCGKPKMEVPPAPDESELLRKLTDTYSERLKQAILTETKQARKKAVEAIKEEALDALSPEVEPPALPPPGTPERSRVSALFEEVARQTERALIVSGVRADHRTGKDIRP